MSDWGIPGHKMSWRIEPCSYLKITGLGNRCPPHSHLARLKHFLVVDLHPRCTEWPVTSSVHITKMLVEMWNLRPHPCPSDSESVFQPDPRRFLSAPTFRTLLHDNGSRLLACQHCHSLLWRTPSLCRCVLKDAVRPAHMEGTVWRPLTTPWTGDSADEGK